MGGAGLGVGGRAAGGGSGPGVGADSRRAASVTATSSESIPSVHSSSEPGGQGRSCKSQKKQKSVEGASPGGSNSPMLQDQSDGCETRPMGRKQAKSLSASVHTPSHDFFEKWEAVAARASNFKEYFERIATAKEEEVQIKRSRMEHEAFLKRKEYEDSIMEKNLADFSGYQRAYYAKKQKDIMRSHGLPVESDSA